MKLAIISPLTALGMFLGIVERGVTLLKRLAQITGQTNTDTFFCAQPRLYASMNGGAIARCALPAIREV